VAAPLFGFLQLIPGKTLALCFAASFLLFGVSQAQQSGTPVASVPSEIPPSQFKSESLALLLQVLSQLEEYVRRNQLGYVHNEDVFLSSAIASIESCGRRRDGPERFSGPTQVAFAKDLEEVGRQIAQLHVHADLGKKKESERQLIAVHEAVDRVCGHFSESTRNRARELAGRYLCPMHPDMTGDRNGVCPKCGYFFSQIRRAIPGGGTNLMALSPRITATIQTSAPVDSALETRAVLRLAKPDGSPVFGSDLIPSHGSPIHLLLVDASLTDYQHVHPKGGNRPGEYEFNFTPHRSGAYFAWADVRPFPMGLQEYAMTSMSGVVAGDTRVNQSETNCVVSDGLVWKLSFEEKEIWARRPAHGQLQVTHLDGSPCRELEPWMESFVHFAGFYEDRQTVLHLHPSGSPVLETTARGGPEIKFVLFAPRAGFVRLFAEGRINKESKTGSFGLRIGPWDGTEVICAPSK